MVFIKDHFAYLLRERIVRMCENFNYPDFYILFDTANSQAASDRQPRPRETVLVAPESS